MLKIEVANEEQQVATGSAISAVCPPGAIIYLHGDLGAGKTTLVRGFIQGLGHKGSVKSPTYTLLEPYEIEGNSYCHLDLYRLADAGELEYLGLRDLLDDGATLLVEWPEKGAGELPVPDLIIHIDYLQQGRNLEIRAQSELGEEILNALSGKVK